jgi:ribosome assembly protein 1
VSVVESLPSPPDAQASRLARRIDDSPGSKFVDLSLRKAMINSDAGKNVPVVAYVSKMLSIPESQLPSDKRRKAGALSPEEARELGRKKREEIAKLQAVNKSPENNVEDLGGSLADMTVEDRTEKVSDPEHLIGFARLYSGTLSVGDSIYVLPPKFNPEHPHSAPEPKSVVVTALYLLMGRDLETLSSVPAGVVFGIGGLGGHVLKTSTICSQLEGGVNLAGANMGTAPIVRVALEPANPADLDKMISGLRLLVQSDPCAEYEQLESGEHVLLTAGELHLERCLSDLQERFAKCEIQRGEPIVPWRETIIRAEEMLPAANKDLGRGRVVATTTSGLVKITLQVRPLPAQLTRFLVRNIDTVRRLYADKREAENETLTLGEDGEAITQDIVEEDTEVVGNETLTMEEFNRQFRDCFETLKSSERDLWSKLVDQVVGFGPKRTGPNLLVDSTEKGLLPKL